MDRQRLHDNLKELHAELRTPSAIDAEERAMLLGLAREIEALLASETQDAQPPSARLIGRLEEATLRLEAAHPSTTALIGKIVDLLVKMGV